MPEIRFVYADELKKKFAVYAHYYGVRGRRRDEIVRFRSTLEISSIDSCPTNPNDLLKNRRLDAVFIMMNPGSSHPMGGWTSRHTVPLDLIAKNRREGNLELAAPDTTQYQVMRVMASHNWGHVRVLNLSDLVQTRSTDFVRDFGLKECNPLFGGDSHSIFSESRRLELAQRLPRLADVKIVCAWGVNTGLSDLIRLCVKRLGDRPVYGHRNSERTGNYFLHPLPRGKERWIEWLKNVDAALTGGCQHTLEKER